MQEHYIDTPIFLINRNTRLCIVYITKKGKSTTDVIINDIFVVNMYSEFIQLKLQ